MQSKPNDRFCRAVSNVAPSDTEKLPKDPDTQHELSPAEALAVSRTPKRALRVASRHAIDIHALHGLVQDHARQAGYPDAALSAADEAYNRKHRITHPAGTFDDAGLFSLSERCACCTQVQRPTEERPYTEMHHGRSLNHVANLHGVPRLSVQRLVRALEAAASMGKGPVTAHAATQLAVKLRRIFKTVACR
jgi:hypothetical protein